MNLNDDQTEKKHLLGVILNLIKNVNDNRIDVIADEIDFGFLSNYFNEDDRVIAKHLLSDLCLVNGEEEILFKLNFYIPDNETFYKELLDNNRSFTKMRDLYRDIPELNIVGMKAMECERYLKAYQNYKGSFSEGVSLLEPKPIVDENKEVFVPIDTSSLMNVAIARIDNLLDGNKEKDQRIQELILELAKERETNSQLQTQLQDKNAQVERDATVISELQIKIDKLSTSNEELVQFFRDVVIKLGVSLELQNEHELGKKVV